MSNQVVPFAGGKVPAILQRTAADADDLSAGVSGGFAVMSFKGSRWKIKYQGEEHQILNADGDPQGSLEVVLLKANPHITKNYYEQGYTEGAAEAPDCFSLDGMHPDAGANKPQATTCARCPKNVFGSRITPAGKKAKACQDNRRLAITPANDIDNETFGGPMLLRVPAASLADLAMVGKNLKARGFPYNSVSIRIGFDLDVAYPKLTFKPIRPLTDDEAAKVAAMLSNDKLERILAEAIENIDAPPADAEPEAPKDDLFEQPVTTAVKPAAAKPKAAAPAAAAAPKPAAKAAAKPAAKPAAVADNGDLSGEDALDADIKGILSELGDLS